MRRQQQLTENNNKIQYVYAQNQFVGRRAEAEAEAGT